MSHPVESAPQPSKSLEDFEYQQLTGHNTTNGEFKSSEKLRMEYIHLTDQLIYKINHGIDVENPRTGEIETRTPDTVIFLDKSARPVSWLMREMWEKYATDAEGKVYDQPDIRYLNIDREQWVNSIDPGAVGFMDINKVDQSVIRSLRSIFLSPTQKKDGLTEAIDTQPSQLDNKVILVVDEVMSSGRTLAIAKKMLQRAFPTASIGGEHWMKGLTTKNHGLAIGNNDIPVWYQEKEEYGRGVGNRLRDPSDSSASNVTQRLGRWFLSRRLPEADPASLQLRRELKHLVNDPTVLKRPALDRDDYEKRVEQLNMAPYHATQMEIMEIANSK